jgi:hypothetical protein
VYLPIRRGSLASKFKGITETNPIIMNNFFRGLLAGYGAWKLGGGCLSTIIIFAIIWVALGQCS